MDIWRTKAYNWNQYTFTLHLRNVQFVIRQAILYAADDGSKVICTNTTMKMYKKTLSLSSSMLCNVSMPNEECLSKPHELDNLDMLQTLHTTTIPRLRMH
jgi:hypothetical protein